MNQDERRALAILRERGYTIDEYKYRDWCESRNPKDRIDKTKISADWEDEHA